MKRRAYLAAAAGVGVAGCTATDGADPSNGGDSNGGDESTADGDPDADPATDVAGTYDDFEDLSRWEVLAGSLTADERESIVGSQSARLEPESGGDQAVIARRFDEPADFSAVVPGLTVATNATTVPTIQLYDEGGNRIDLRRGVRGGLDLMRYNFGVSDVFGSPDLSRVAEVRIVDWRHDDGNYLRIDDLHFVPRPDTGRVMIQFDDGYETDYTEGFPVLEEYGYPAVSFVNPGRIGVDGRLDLSQARELRDAGWAVGNHTHSHPDLRSLSASEQDAEIRRGKAWLEDHGFERGARYFAYPFGGYDGTTIDLVAKHHELGFAGGFPVQGLAVNPQLCSRIGDPSADDAVGMLDRTAEMNGITTLFYHELEGERLTDFERTIEHLHELESAGEVEVITPRDLADDLAFSG